MQAVNFKPPQLSEPIGPLVWVLEQPVVTAVALSAAGIALFVLLRRRDQARLGLLLGLAMVLAGVAALGVGTVVVTDRESIEMRSRSFVIAAVDGDRGALASLILPEAGLSTGGTTVAEDGQQRIMDLASAQAAAQVIASWRVSRMQSTLSGRNVGTTQFRVRASASSGGPSLSWWKLHWRRDASGVWRISTIDCLAVNGREPGGGLFEWLKGMASGSRLRGF